VSLFIFLWHISHHIFYIFAKHIFLFWLKKEEERSKIIFILVEVGRSFTNRMRVNSSTSHVTHGWMATSQVALSQISFDAYYYYYMCLIGGMIFVEFEMKDIGNVFVGI